MSDPADVQQLIEDLRSKDTDKKFRAVLDLPKLDKEIVVPHLINAIKEELEIARTVEHTMGYTKERLRNSPCIPMAKILRRVGVSQEQLDELINLSRTSEAWFDKTLARHVLGNLQDPRAADYLIADFMDPETISSNMYGGHHIRIAAIKSLVMIGDEKSIRTLTDFIDNRELVPQDTKKRSPELVRRHLDYMEWRKTVAQELRRSKRNNVPIPYVALCVLILFEPQKINSVLQGQIEIIGWLIDQPGKLSELREAAIEGCIISLQNTCSGVRALAAKALGEIGEERAIEVLEPYLDDPDYKVRYAVVEAFKLTNSENVLRKTIGLINDCDSDIRGIVVRILEILGDEQAVDLLIGRLDDDVICLKVIRALNNIGNLKAVEPLIRQLEHDSIDRRLHVVKALENLGGSKAIAALIIQLRHVRSELSSSAAESLANLPVEPVLEGLIDAHLNGKIGGGTDMFTKVLSKIAEKNGATIVYEKLCEAVHNVYPERHRETIQRRFKRIYLKIVTRMRRNRNYMKQGKLSEGIPKPPGRKPRGTFRVARAAFQ